jgi:PAS domain S-box-containing protein
MSEPGGQRDTGTPSPFNEAERLDVLRHYDILDTPPEETFDEIAHLAATICATPVALIGFVDADRCWFKARIGVAATQAPRDELLLQPEDVFLVRDAPNSLLPDLRFFAGAPLVSPEGCVLGALCVGDAAPRDLEPDCREALRTLAHQVMGQLEARRQAGGRERAEAARREAETRYQSLFENAVEGFFRTTPEGSYLAANPMLARIYGYDSTEELVERLTDIENQLYVDPERRLEFQRLLAETDAVHGFESQVRRKDGRIIWIRENARALRDAENRLLGYEGTVEDITDRVRAEWALRRASEELEMRVQQRTAELARANEALEQSAAERKRFYREVIRCVTRNKFHLVDAAEVTTAGELVLDTPLDEMVDYPRMRERLRQVAAEAGMEVPVIRDLVLAAGEAATNAIKHDLSEDRIIVRISDQGTGISTEDLPASLLQPGFSTKISMGMGYTLMLELVDKVWLATGQEGTIVQMEKWLNPKEHVELPFLSAWAKF